jgi:tetratricopeptide (TPR) repeat protein
VTHRRIAVLCLALAGLALYSGTLGHDFALDDRAAYTHNRFVQQGFAGIPDLLSQDSHAGFGADGLLSGGRYRPLSLVTFAIERELGAGPGFAHFVNALLYALTGALLYLWLEVLLGASQWRVALAAALLFLAHPVHTETVANIKGRDEVLCFLLVLGSLLALFAHVDRGGSRLRLALSVGLFALALLAKETAFTFVAVIPALLFVLRDKTAGETARLTAPFAGCAVAVLVLRTLVAGYAGDREAVNVLIDPLLDASFAERSATAFYCLAYYARLLVWPVPLVHDYSYDQIPLVDWSHPVALASLVGHLALAGFAVFGGRRRHPAALLPIWYLATLSIASNLAFPIGALIGERFLYVPSLAFCAALAAVLFGAARPARLGAAPALVLVALLVTGWSGLTWARNADWRDDWTLIHADIGNAQDSTRAWTALGEQLMLRYRSDPRGQRELLPQAERAYGRALEIYDRGAVRTRLGEVLLELGRAADAAPEFERAILQMPTWYRPVLGAARAQLALGEPSAALPLYLRAHTLDPGRAKVEATIGRLLIAEHRLAEAVPYLRAAQRRGLDPEAGVLLADTLRALGRRAER